MKNFKGNFQQALKEAEEYFTLCHIVPDLDDLKNYVYDYFESNFDEIPMEEIEKSFKKFEK